MLRHYKEIFYGLIFGLGAACIDTFVDASTEQKAFWDFGPGMLLYRGLFILFGFLVGDHPRTGTIAANQTGCPASTGNRSDSQVNTRAISKAASGP